MSFFYTYFCKLRATGSIWVGTVEHSDLPAAASWEPYTTNTQCQSQTAGLPHTAGIPPHTLTEKQTEGERILLCISIRASRTEERTQGGKDLIRFLSSKCSKGVKINTVLSVYPLSLFISCESRLASLPWTC